jgi:hypothetical protein
MKMSEYLHSGRSTAAQHGSEDEGHGFYVSPRRNKAREQAALERGEALTRQRLHARFDRQGINDASLADYEAVGDAVYDFSFEPRDSAVISKLEYSTIHRFLRASFSNNGAVVTYGGVPMNVFARLQYTEQSGGSVGAAFWDTIRIYERRGLTPGGPYYPKMSNFVQKGSKYPFIYEGENTSKGPRASKYAPTIDAEARAEVLTQEVISGRDADGNLLTPDELKERVKVIKKLKDGDVSAEMLDRIDRSIRAEDSESQREQELASLMGSSYDIEAGAMGGDADVGQQYMHTTKGSGAKRKGSADVLSKLESLDPSDPDYAAKRAALFAEFTKQSKIADYYEGKYGVQ